MCARKGREPDPRRRPPESRRATDRRLRQAPCNHPRRRRAGRGHDLDAAVLPGEPRLRNHIVPGSRLHSRRSLGLCCYGCRSRQRAAHRGQRHETSRIGGGSRLSERRTGRKTLVADGSSRRRCRRPTDHVLGSARRRDREGARASGRESVAPARSHRRPRHRARVVVLDS